MAPIQRPETGLEYETIPPYDPYAMSRLQHRMNNPDPTNEFMYQIPPANPQSENNQIDLQKLNERLRFLNLKSSSEEDLNASYLATTDHLQSGFQSPNPEVRSSQYYRKYPSTAEIGPGDSISMYRPSRRPSESMRSGRQGGTNVDPDEGDRLMSPASDMPDMLHDGQSFIYTAKSPTPSSPGLEPVTPGQPTGLYNTGSVQGDMHAMRDRLLRSQSQRDRYEGQRLAQKIDEASQLAAACAKLEAAQEQVRTLQATLIAEQVARHQLEDASKLDDHNFRECRNELSTAVRALRRSREEQRRTDEERRKIARGFEQVKTQLHRYHEELQVREARARGREEGRAEAWQEAERWMGQSPPIPTDPIQNVPEAVFRQTPMMGASQAIPPAPLPQNNQYQGQQLQPGQQPVSRPSQQQYQTPQQQFQFPSPTYPQGSSPSLQTAQQGQPGIHQILQQSPSPPRPPDQQQFIQPGYTGQSYRQPAQPQQTDQTSGRPAQQPSYQSVDLQQQSQQPVQPPSSFVPGSLSVPQRPAPLPQQRPRAATLTYQTQRKDSENTRPPYSSSLHVPQIDSVPRQTAADSYLDRVEHDSNLKDMLAGAPTRTLHTSVFPQSVRSTVGNGGRVSEEQGSSDKPLPNPFIQQQQNAVGRSQTTRPSRAGTMNSQVPVSTRGNRRMSLSEGLHAHSHLSSQVPDGDRYPVFPHAGGKHSRQSSYGSVDPTRFALPPSGMASRVQSPNDQASSVRQTPQSRSTRSRSRMAGGLRHDGDLEPELSAVDEAEEDTRLPLSEYRPPAPQPRSTPPQEAYSTVMRNLSPRQKKPPQIKKAPSMPMRWQPMPVMPTRLGRARSEAPSRLPELGAPITRSVYQDRRYTYDVPRTQNLSVPPETAPQVTNDSFENGGGLRHSALGLEGIESLSRGRTSRAPTSSNNLSVPRSAAAQSTIPETKSRPSPFVDPRNFPLPASKSTAPTVYSPPTHNPSSVKAHEHPLPPSRSQAPTRYSVSPKSVDRRPMPAVSTHDYAVRAPLPESRATTMFATTVITEPDREQVYTKPATATSRKPSVDPRQYPLPASRAPSQRPRASTYARTEGTIEEVTEEESGKEGPPRRH
ncbi:hypothetical protein BCR39DRAFT_268546 [Naematelia encephala]|uniref:Uncharacterized protein n=1 Tax=Naematelia encephala TaxID=71784 RepID=A0A1Y2BG50_9TREE|nr:hypothetical protein BCR39DRAFT_268546 [Naematelia encephala]